MIDPKIFQAQLTVLLASDSPLEAVLDFLRGLIATGETRSALAEEVASVVSLLSLEEGDGEDVLLDAMDFLVGWCQPGRAL